LRHLYLWDLGLDKRQMGAVFAASAGLPLRNSAGFGRRLDPQVSLPIASGQTSSLPPRAGLNFLPTGNPLSSGRAKPGCF
jgi:hypothetical protein